MAALELRPGAGLDPAALSAFLEDQPDLGTKWAPSFVRVTERLPLTPSNKVLKRQLRRERWECADPVWWAPVPPARGGTYRRLTTQDAADLRAQFRARGRTAALEAV